ncbi:heat shock protein 30 [Sparassis latifolia]|uniref:Protein FDD123 n=2 Tax=Sparassis TaxID=40466 RepID=A0A401GI95_9APHY|nr:Protein FDD123 [Sparassis crispa]AYN55356.1 opsin2 [Sparassis latifolia]GBE81920.1 Protein FDD123 [Sparassis crispa]
MGNKALQINPPNANINLSTHGSDWLWAVFSIMAVSLLVAIVANFLRPWGTRLFHQIAIIILTTASISYFAMASDLGATPVRVEFRKHGDSPTRQVWFVRYIQWFITFPLVVLELLLTTGLPLSDVFTAIFMSIVVVVSGLVGSLVPSTYKWGFYVFGVVALFYIWYVLLLHGPRASFAADLRAGYFMCAGWLSFITLLYPISWALSEGGNVIKPTSEMIFYGILDLLAGPLFLCVFLFSLRSVDYAAFSLQSGKYSGTGGEAGAGPVRQTKAAEAGAAAQA